MRKRALLYALLMMLMLALSACALPDVSAFAPATPAAALPDVRLLAVPEPASVEATQAEPSAAAEKRIDLWLEASQVMGGINPIEKSMYPHMSRKYREGGFQYHFEGQAGWYEQLLKHLLAVGEGNLTRVLRVGSERLTDAFLSQNGFTADSDDGLRSLRRDLLTTAIDPMPTLVERFAGEDMTDSFYSLASPWLDGVQLLDEQARQKLENPDEAERYALALEAQRQAIQNGDVSLVASRTDDASPLLYALLNLDLTRLSVITCDPASLRRLSDTDASGARVAYIERVLSERGVFDAGLCVGVYAFTLDYMGQMTSFGTADFTEPLMWGRLQYNSNTRTATAALPMPRTLLMLVIGQPSEVDAFTADLNARMDADAVLHQPRGAGNEELSYARNGETLYGAPISFAYEYVCIRRPVVETLTNATAGASLTGAEGGVVTLPLSSAEPTLTLSFPAAAMPEGSDLSTLQNVQIALTDAIIQTDALPNTPDAALPEGAQTIALRDTLYVFAHNEAAENPITLSAFRFSDDRVSASLTLNADALQAGWYRFFITADRTGELVAFAQAPWEEAKNVTLTNAQVSAWETFTALITEYDRDCELVPKQFWHAWGAVNARGYHGSAIPDFPPVEKAQGLSELMSQLRNAASVETEPFVRYTFDLLITND